MSVPLVAIATLLVAWLIKREKRGRGGLALILIGGVANLMSRVLYGGVVDNLSLAGVLYNNLADYLIFFGVVWYGYTHIVRRQRASRHR